MKLQLKLTLPLSILILLAGCGKKIDESLVFQSGTDGYECYRIPAIVRTPNNVLLAFAEGRKNGCSDTGDIDLVLKTSTDQGKTWDSLKVIRHLDGYTSGNPAPIVDMKTGVVHLLFTQNLGEDAEHEIIDELSTDTRRVFYMKSPNDGVTWTQPREITDQVKLPSWTWYATGPGSGIQLQNEKYSGRLVVGCDHIVAGSKKYYSHVIYSDNEGRDWKLGGSSPQDQVNECEVVEIDSGELVINMRNYDRSKHSRKVARSDDGGMSWSDLRADSALVEPICQASLHRHEWTVNNSSAYLFSNPASDTARINMTVRKSLDNTATWSSSKVIYAGPSAYSDLVSIDITIAGVLYEAGVNSPYESIRFHWFSLEF